MRTHTHTNTLTHNTLPASFSLNINHLCRRLYPNHIRVKYGAEMVTADFESRKAVLSVEQGMLGKLRICRLCFL